MGKRELSSDQPEQPSVSSSMFAIGGTDKNPGRHAFDISQTGYYCVGQTDTYRSIPVTFTEKNEKTSKQKQPVIIVTLQDRLHRLRKN